MLAEALEEIVIAGSEEYLRVDVSEDDLFEVRTIHMFKLSVGLYAKMKFDAPAAAGGDNPSHV